MDFDAVSLIKNRLSELPYSFIFPDISSRFSIEGVDFSESRRAIDGNQDFVCTFDDEDEEQRYIARRSLYVWFVRLSLRLARIELCTLSERQLLSKMNSLRLSGTWNHPPNDYIRFAQDFGLLNHLEGQDRYDFPLATVMSFFSRSNIETAREYLLSRSYNSDITPEFEELILERLRNALGDLLASRQQYIILRRQGILGFDAMTLEEVGQGLGLTRERVRQIEVRCWRRIRHPSRRSFRSELVSLLLIYVLNRNGSLLLTSSNIHREIAFICEYLNVPLWTLPYINIMSIGDVSCSINLPDNIWVDLSNLRTNVKNFLSTLPLQLTQEDVEEIADMFIPIILKRLMKIQKVYLVLKQIGRPAHFSEVTDMYIQMFPREYTTEHSIHATLLREKYGIVWIGSKGTFALEEWGYQRPTSSLMDTIAQIVGQKYQDTGSPVPFVVVQAEIGKYRRFVNPNSLVLASCCNPKLQTVDGLRFLPREEADDEQEMTDNELDRILREFEKQTKV
jgi:hypothetical protein